MACERDRIIALADYFNSLGINLNLLTTKARGNKGVFIRKSNGINRIDISKDADSEQILSIMLHEFAHFVHSQYDKTMNSLDFVFGEITEDIKEELVNVTLQAIPKEYISPLFKQKNKINSEIKKLASDIRAKHQNFKLSMRCKEIEKNFTTPMKYLLKYDRIKYFNKIYSVDNISEFKAITAVERDYILLKSKQRMIKRINSRINRLNNYYGAYNELFARFIELYYTNYERAAKIAPNLCKKMQCTKVQEFDNLDKIFAL